MARLPPTLLVLRDALLVAGLALLVFLVLRKWGGDYYRVPSGSMEPLLYGDPRRGDLVFVDKTAKAADCRRHDLVVVVHPSDSREQLVKRIAARGDDVDCWIDLRDGDVWLGPATQQLQRETKDPLASRGMRVPWAAWPAAGTAAGAALDLRAALPQPDGLLLAPLADGGPATVRATFRPAARRPRRDGGMLPAGFVGTARAVDATYLDALGERGREGDDVFVHDCGLDVRFAGAPAAVFVAIETRGEAFTFCWLPAAGRVELWRDGEDVAAASLPPCDPGEHRLECGRLDGRLFFAVDGRTDALFVVPLAKEWLANGPGLPVGPRTQLGLAVAGAAPVELLGFAVFRDVYAYRERIAGMPGQPGEWPQGVPAGHWFLLGDNAFDSHDSRHFGPVPSASFLGSPALVLGPWPRTRWLRP